MNAADKPHDENFNVDRFANDFVDAGEERLLAANLSREDYERIADFQLLDAMLAHLLHPEKARVERCVARVLETIKSEEPLEAACSPAPADASDEAECNEDVGPLLELISAILESTPAPAEAPAPRPEPEEFGLPPVPLLSPLGAALRRWTQIGLLTYLASASVVLTVSLIVQLMWEEKQPETASERLAAQASFEDFRPVGVGQITGMNACRWADGAQAGFYERVCIGQQLHLEAGLLEITYDTGFKAILQGPVKYKVTSANGGFLSLGRLTGNATTERARGFAVDTPTATVTDLGTEFGAEVMPDGRMQTVVFSGEVKLVTTTPQGRMGTGQFLRAGQAAEVVQDENDPAAGELGWFPKVIAMAMAQNDRFTRAMPPIPVETLISPTQCNGSFEEPLVGPGHFDAEASDPAKQVYAKTKDIALPFWNQPYALRTKGTTVRGVTGEQYAVVQGAITVFSTRFDGQQGHPPLRHFAPRTIYVLTADVGSNVPGARGQVAFGVGTHSNSHALSFSVSERNAMEPITALSLDTSKHPELVGQPINISFVNVESSPTSLLYLDNVVLQALPAQP